MRFPNSARARPASTVASPCSAARADCRAKAICLFHNDGAGRFNEVGTKAGVADPRGYFGLGIAWFDANADGWPDLYVANDSTPNFLYLNQKDGTFKEAAFPQGVAVSEDGAEQGSMGVAIGDYNASGRFSLFITNFAEEYNALYRNDGDHFTDVSFASKTAASSLPYVGWGTAFFDYDNDSWEDLIAVNGHVYPQLDQARLGASAGYRQRKLLYHNNRGDGTFEDVSMNYGPVLSEPRVSRGLAAGDLDNDGRLDLVINDLDGVPAGAAQRGCCGRPLAARQAARPGRQPRRARRHRHGAHRRPQPDTRGAQRHELHLAGRHAAALRAGRGRSRRQHRGALARRHHHAPRERERRPDRDDRTGALTPRARHCA